MSHVVLASKAFVLVVPFFRVSFDKSSHKYMLKQYSVKMDIIPLSSQ